MPTYETSISIAAPPEAIWPLLADVVAWPQWLPTVSQVQALDGRALAIGARYVVRQPKLRPATWVVTELEHARHFVWLAKSHGFRMVAEHRISAGAAGPSTLVLRFTFAGLLGGLVGRLSRSVTENYLAQEAAAIKKKVESLS